MVWIVLDSDYDNTWVVAIYPTESLAEEHVKLMGGWIAVEDVRAELHPDATDPIKRNERTAEEEKQRQSYQHYLQHQESNAQLSEAQRPSPPYMRLCHCQTFSERPGYFWTKHGYCRYCGGWDPQVFREHMGDAALQEKIDELAIHDRQKMREIVAPPADRAGE